MNLNKGKIIAFFLGAVGTAVIFLSVVVPWDEMPMHGKGDTPRQEMFQPGPQNPGQGPGGNHEPTKQPGFMPSDNAPGPGFENEGGPYSPYPVSFPKVLGGLLFFEEKLPKLAATAEQCEELIPVWDGMGRAWKQADDINKNLRKLLTPQQENYILEHKSDFEQTSFHRKAWELLNQKITTNKNPGEFVSISEYCLQRAAEAKGNPDYERATGKDIITNSDISIAIVFMDDDPNLRISPYQGGEFGPLFRKINSFNGVTESYFTIVKQIVTSEQIEAVKEHIKEIIPYKKSVFENVKEGSKRDPLFDAVIKMCEKKVKK